MNWLLPACITTVSAITVAAAIVVLCFKRAYEQSRRQLEALRQSEERFRQLFDNAADAVCIHDEQGRIVDVNQIACDAVGYSRAELLGMRVSDIEVALQPADLAPLWERIRSGQSVTVEGVHRRRDGTTFPVELRIAVFSLGESPLFFAAARDITERKRVEEALRFTQNVVDRMADGAFWINPEGRFIYVNEAACLSLGYSREELLALRVSDIDPGFTATVNWTEYWEERHKARKRRFETTHKAKDGHCIPVEIRSDYLQMEGQEYVCSFARDISARKAADEDLRRAHDAAQAASHAKDRFLAAASHELRTPLTPILLLASSLEHDASLSPAARQDIALILEHLNIEKRLVDDLLDFSAIHAGKVQLRLQNASLHAVLRAAIETCRAGIATKNLRLDVQLRATRDLMKADPDRLRQIFWNILQNATKFTPSGGAIAIATEDDGPDSIRVTISDTGRGIDPQTLPRVFEPFEQGPRTEMQHYGGLGLGLAISRTLVESHRGTIEVASEGADRGATFTLRFPLLPPTAVAAEPTAAIATPTAALHAAEAEPGRLRILLVEDHLQTNRILTRLLTADGHAVTPALSLAEALAAVGQEPFDLVLSDIGLPDGSGFDLMARLKERYQLKGIALSGYSSQADRQASFQAGFSEHLSKPVTLEALREALMRVIAGETSPPATPSAN